MKILSNTLKRNDALIKSKLNETKGNISVKEKLHALIPKRYQNAGLFAIGRRVSSVAIFILSDDNNNYALLKTPITITLEPSVIEDVTLDGVDYIRLTFNKGDLFLADREVIQDSGFVFDMVEDFNVKGKIPLFLTPFDLMDIYSKARKYLNSGVADNSLGIELSIAINARANTDSKIPIRLAKKDLRKLKFSDVKYIGLNNVFNGRATNIAKFTGRYFNDSLTSIMLDEDNIEADIEKYYKL
jgi:hypothetical protein